jgi:hypothetical protein
MPWCHLQELIEDYLAHLQRPGTPCKTFRIKVYVFMASEEPLTPDEIMEGHHFFRWAGRAGRDQDGGEACLHMAAPACCFACSMAAPAVLATIVMLHGCRGGWVWGSCRACLLLLVLSMFLGKLSGRADTTLCPAHTL